MGDSSEEAAQVCDDLAAAALHCSQSPSLETATAVASCLSALLKHGLKGNRLVDATPWSVIKAMGRAFPLLLDKSIQQAERSALATTSPAGAHDEACMLAWGQQAMAKGLIGPFLLKLGSQPQVATAYAADAPVRNHTRLKEIANLLQALQEPLSKLYTPPAAVPAPASSKFIIPGAAGVPETEQPQQPGGASTGASHIQTDEEVLAARKQQAESNKARRQRGWWGYTSSAQDPAKQQPSSSTTQDEPPAPDPKGEHPQPAAAAAESVLAAAAAVLPTKLAFTSWGGAGSGGGAAPAKPSGAAAAAPQAGGSLQEPDISAAASQAGSGAQDSHKDTLAPAGVPLSSSMTAASSSLVTVQISVTEGSEQPIKLTLSYSQQAAGGYYGSWARLMPFRLWGAAAAADAVAPGAPSAPGAKENSGAEAASAAVQLGTAAAADSSAAAARELQQGAGVSVSIHVLPRPDADRLLTLSLKVQPAPAPEASSVPSSTSSWMYGAASSMGKLVDASAWTRAPARPPKAAAETRPQQAPEAVGPSGEQAAGLGDVAGGSDDEADLGMLEDMKLVLGGGQDSVHDHPFPPFRQPSRVQARESEEGGPRGSTGGEGAAGDAPADASLVARSESGHYSTNTIRLVLDVTQLCSEQQQAQNQAGLCAGCGSALPSAPAPPARTAAPSSSYFWAGNAAAVAAAAAAGGPRACWYTGKLYCHQCHHGQVAVIPGRVLHKWDFVPRPVCCAVQDYLASICDHPLLCLTAINPGLLAKVTQLAEAKGLRQRVRAKVAAAQRGGHSSAVLDMKKAAGPRDYLLGEMEDFWSLSDLIDLSKGALATLPKWLVTVEADLTAVQST